MGRIPGLLAPVRRFRFDWRDDNADILKLGRRLHAQAISLKTSWNEGMHESG